MIATTTPEDVANQVLRTLQDLCSALCLEPYVLAEREHLADMTVVAHPSVDEFPRLFPLSRVETWFSVLGEDLRIRIAVSDHPASYNLTSSDYADISTLLQLLDRFDIEHIAVNVEVKKDHLRKWIADVAGVSIDALFFYPITLESRLNIRGIDALLREGALSPRKHSVICVLDSTGLLQNPYLTIVGVREQALRQIRTPPSRAVRERVWAASLGMRNTVAIWSAPLSDIAPDLFYVDEVQPGLESIRKAMTGICDALALLQFCSTVSEHSTLVIANVAQSGGGHIEMKSDAAYRSTPSLLGSSPFRMYRWAFRGESYDKIDVVRDLMIRELRSISGDAVTHLIAASPQLLEAARASYRIVRKQAFESYLRSRDDAQAKVSVFMASTRDNIDKLRGAMLTRVLEFFAALIAYLTADVLKTNIPRSIKAIGVGLGLFYLVLIAIFQLYPAWRQNQKEHDEALQAVESHTELTPAERQRFVSRLPSGRRTEFTDWFWACVTVYGLGAVALIVAFVHYLR